MRRVVVAGRWDGARPLLPTGVALEEIGRGLRAGGDGLDVVLVPFGSGPTFDEAVAACRSQASFVRVPTEASSTRQVGERVAAALGEPRVVVEGGHGASPDCGLGFLAGLLGVAESDVSGEGLGPALTRAEDMLGASGTDLVCAASTPRPLLGFDSVLAVAPDLNPIEEQDTSLTGNLMQAFAHRPLGRRLLLEDSKAHPGRMWGSGAGGGVGAVIAAIGGRIVGTGEVLADLTRLGAALTPADLVIVVEPELSSPLLAQSTMGTITNAAAELALPVVAVTVRSSLSRYERAQWGLHGVFETEARITLEEAGRRIARTWLR